MVSLHQAKVHIFISVVISFSNGGDVVSNRLNGGKQSTDTNGCYFKIIDIEKVKHQFTQLSILGNVQMIRFNVEILQNNTASANYEYFQSLNGLYSNGLERWMWMLQKHSHLLSYSPDFEVVTLNRSTAMQRNIYIPVEAFTSSNKTGESHYKNCTESLFFVIFKELLNQTNLNSDWLFCHRYFEGQQWKLGFLYKATGAWIGYDFECFSSNCQNTRCAQHIEKGTVNVIINISILVVSILRTIIYTFFVAGPLFSSFSYDTLALVLAISLYVIKYVVNFYQIYKNLLDTLLKMQIEDDVAKDKQPTITVDLFKKIVDDYVPLRTQLVMLLLKILVTSLFLYVAIDTLGKVGKEDLFTSPIPALVATIMPILAEKLCSSNPQIEIKLQKDFIQKELRKPFKHNIEGRSHFTITAWMIIFPAFYTILRPVVSLFDTLFCTNLNNGKVDEEENTPLIIN
ncbi:Hypothetical predicted protein [Mytilus galloprovincialis]|uniref:Uncharacterized protein n=1 Tax=Mytilus galloprovincialis TaxID=29158 RepID=A0A8B6DWK2_MYTGA|nr:Hypothetical predicted protein [Mytilus galloprovincialis]